MKKLVLFAVISMVALGACKVYAANAVLEQFDKLFAIGSAFKKEKFAHCKEKLELCQKHHNECEELKKELITNWADGDQLTDAHLAKIVSLIAQHISECKKLEEKWREVAAKSAESFKKFENEFTKDRQSMNIQPEPKTITIQPVGENA